MDLSFLESFNLWQLPQIMARLSCYIVRFGLIVAAIGMVASGIAFLLSRGNPAAFAGAKKFFLYALVGALIIYGVYTIILSLSFLISGSTNLPWIPLNCGASNNASNQAATALSGNTSQVIDLTNQVNSTTGTTQAAAMSQLSSTLVSRSSMINQYIQTDPTAVWDNLLTQSQVSSLPTSLQTLAEQPISLSSVPIDVYHIDDFQNKLTSYEYYANINGQYQQIYITGGDADILSGSSVNISGYSLSGGGVITSNSSQNFQVTSAASVSGSTGNQRTLVVLVNFQNDTSQPFDQNQTRQYLQTLADFYRDNSYGQVTFSFDVIGWFTLSKNTNAQHCVDEVEHGDIKKVLNPRQINYNSYDRLIVFVQGCGGGYGSIGKTYGDINGLGVSVVGLDGYESPWNIYSFLDSALWHEMGHSLGVWHATSWYCPLVGGHGRCGDEYGNPFDVMGNGHISTHLNVGHKDTLNWLSPLIISQSGRYSLQPQESNPSGAVIISRVIPRNPNLFYLEYRTAASAFDSNLWNWQNNLNGLLVNWISGVFQGTRLLDMNTSDPTSWVLPVGGRFTNSYYDLDITVVSADESQIVFDVSFSSNPPTPTPTFSPTPTPPSPSTTPRPTIIPTPTQSPSTADEWLRVNEYLYPGQSLRSTNGLHELVLQNDGNLVLYRISDMAPLWESNTAGTIPDFLVMSSDGNLVLYSRNSPSGPNFPSWQSGTSGNPGAALAMQNGGQMIIYTSVVGGTPIWIRP